MNKLTPTLRHGRNTGSIAKGTVLGEIMTFCNNDIRPILDMVHDKKTSEVIKKSLKKFLIISLVSTMEFYFKNMTSYYVNKNNVDLTKLFKNELCIKLSDLDLLVKNNFLTRGNIVSSSVSFYDLGQINTFVSNLLDIDFFTYLYQENTRDKCKMMITNAPTIDIDYNKLYEAFTLRHSIVHDLSEVTYSYTHIRNLWDNAMNMFDIATTIFRLPNELDSYRRQYGRKRRKEESS